MLSTDSQASPARYPGRPLRVDVSRTKKESLPNRAAFRGYYALRRFLRPRLLLEALSGIARFSQRVLYEQVWFTFPPEEAAQLLRPHLPDLIRRGVRPGDRVIDLGGGRGLAARVAAEKAAHVLMAELDPAGVAAAKELCRELINVEVLQADALTALRERQPFDVALLLHFLEHAEDPVAMLREVARHARRVVIEVPDFASDPLNYVRLDAGLPCHSDSDHTTEFTEAALAEALEKSGWTTVELDACNGVLVAIADVPSRDTN